MAHNTSLLFSEKLYESRDEALRETQGFVLPVVLLVLALLVVLGLGMSRAAKVQIADAYLQAQRMDDELAIRNGVSELLMILLSGKMDPDSVTLEGRRILTDGTPVKVGGVECRVYDLAGFVSLGQYDEALFSRVLRSLVDSSTAQKVAAKLGDWMDQDDRKRYLGMERADYVALHRYPLPPNRPLRSLDELLDIPGVTPYIYNGKKDGHVLGLRDLLVVGGVPWFNAAVAPKVLLGPVLNLPAEDVDRLLSLRKQKKWDDFVEVARGGGVNFNEYSPIQPSRKYRVIVKGESGNIARVRINIGDGVDVPFVMFAWMFPDHARF